MGFNGERLEATQSTALPTSTTSEGWFTVEFREGDWYFSQYDNAFASTTLRSRQQPSSNGVFLEPYSGRRKARCRDRLPAALATRLTAHCQYAIHSHRLVQYKDCWLDEPVIVSLLPVFPQRNSGHATVVGTLQRDTVARKQTPQIGRPLNDSTAPSDRAISVSGFERATVPIELTSTVELEFLEQYCHYLSSITAATAIWIGLQLPCQAAIQMVVTGPQTDRPSQFSYALDGTPEAEALTTHTFSTWSGQDLLRFPETHHLTQFSPQTVTIYPLYNRHDRPLGTIVIVLKHAPPQQLASVLECYATRVSRELEQWASHQSSDNHLHLYQQIIDTLPQMLFWTDRKSGMLGGNRSWADSISVHSHHTQAPLMHIINQEDWNESNRLVVETGQPWHDIAESSTQTSRLARWYAIGKYPLHNQSGYVTGILHAIEDVTYSKTVEERASFLQLLSQAIAQATTFNHALATVLRHLREHFQWPFAECWLPNDSNQRLTPGPISYSSAAEVQSFRQLTQAISLKAHEGIAGRAWSTAQVQRIVNQSQLESDSDPRVQAAIETGFEAGLGLPIANGDRVLAVLVFYAYESKDMAAHRIEFSQWIIGQIATTIHGKCVEQALREAEQKYRSIFENAVEGIYQATPDGTFLVVNPMMARIFGYDSPQSMIEQLDGLREGLYVNPHRYEEFIQLMQAHGVVHQFESEVFHQDGSTLWISENARTIFDSDGCIRAYEGTVEDVTARRHDRETIEFMAYYDVLTQLPNRILLNDRLTMALSQAQRCHEMAAVLFVDLDRFKTINDTLGHDTGDVLLQQVATRLLNCLRQGDTIARWGGDEFTLLLAQIRDRTLVDRLANRILQAFTTPFKCNGYELHVTCSLGVAIYPQDGQDFKTLLKHADTALYRAKESGRNTYVNYIPEMNEQVSRLLALENGLRLASERNELELYYQPQIQLNTGAIVGVEALVRWHHPELGLVSPDAFIPVAEETGLVLEIGEWVLRRAITQAKQWHEAFPSIPLRMAVNLSARQFQQINLSQTIADILLTSNLEGQYLDLEITESTAIQNIDFTLRVLKELQSMGVNLSIDDFGTGYSSISYLRRFPFDALKIDRSLIRDISINASAAAVAKAAVTLGQGLNLQVLAEGVETEEQLNFLRSLGCDMAQGYWFSKPIPTHAMTVLLGESQGIPLWEPTTSSLQTSL